MCMGHGQCMIDDNQLDYPFWGRLIISAHVQTLVATPASQVLCIDNDLALVGGLWSALSGLAESSRVSSSAAAAVSPMEAIRRLISQPVEVEAETAEELHLKVWSGRIMWVTGRN